MLGNTAVANEDAECEQKKRVFQDITVLEKTGTWCQARALPTT